MNRGVGLTAVMLAMLVGVYMVVNLPKLMATAVYWDMTLGERPMARVQVLDRDFPLPTSGLEDARGREVYFVSVDDALLSDLENMRPAAVATDAYEAVEGMVTGPGYVSTWGGEARLVFLSGTDARSKVAVLRRIRENGS